MKDTKYVHAKIMMQKIFFENDIFLIRLDLSSCDPKCLSFKRYSVYENSQLTIFNKPISPNLLRNRSQYNAVPSFLFGNNKVVPQKHISSLSADKRQQYLLCKQWQPKTYLLSRFLDDDEAKADLGDEIIIKPRNGSNGNEIIKIKTKNVISKQIKYKDAFIVQKVCYFGQGVPGWIDGNHDVRVIFLGGIPHHVTVRKPSGNDFRSNISHGGSQHAFYLKEVPNELISLAADIASALHAGGLDIFSLDFGYDAVDKQRYMIEMNASPGIWYDDNDRELQKLYFTDIAKYFNSLHC